MSGENPAIKSRFDLEQEILECWKVVDDVKYYVETGSNDEQWSALRTYYEKKFNRMWGTFEKLIEQGNLK